MLKRRKYRFLSWILFSIITCGIYHIYHEGCKSTDIATTLERVGVAPTFGLPPSIARLTAVLLAGAGFSIILDSIQQADINAYYGSKSL